MRDAVDKLTNNLHPLGDLKPPPGCVACAGSHRPHHFLCLQRIAPSNGNEKSLRNRVMAALRAAWSAQQNEAQTVRSLECTHPRCQPLTSSPRPPQGSQQRTMTYTPNLSTDCVVLAACTDY